MGPKEIESVAKIAHEINRQWCIYTGDMTQLAWESAPGWQKDSAVNGVIFHLENPDAGDEGSHNNWMAEKLTDGWVYGEVKDPAAKTHPCIVDYLDLPANQRFKDRLFRTVVHAAM